MRKYIWTFSRSLLGHRPRQQEEEEIMTHALEIWNRKYARSLGLYIGGVLLPQLQKAGVRDRLVGILEWLPKLLGAIFYQTPPNYSASRKEPRNFH
jgi:hypothetical protein